MLQDVHQESVHYATQEYSARARVSLGQILCAGVHGGCGIPAFFVLMLAHTDRRRRCDIRVAGLDAAQRGMLQCGSDPRPPMASIYRLFQGRASPEDVLRSAAQSVLSEAPPKDAVGRGDDDGLSLIHI